jgi:hypothetical protein
VAKNLRNEMCVHYQKAERMSVVFMRAVVLLPPWKVLKDAADVRCDFLPISHEQPAAIK